jgi:predicted transcriptional regulator
MASMDEQILRAAKEIVVKFIETGRVSPSSFPEAFKSIYETLRTTVDATPPETADDPEPPGAH